MLSRPRSQPGTAQPPGPPSRARPGLSTSRNTLGALYPPRQQEKRLSTPCSWLCRGATESRDVSPSPRLDILIAIKSSRFLARFLYPPGIDETRELIGADPREHFQLDLWRLCCGLPKLGCRHAAGRSSSSFAWTSTAHRTQIADGTRLRRSRLHMYRKGFDEKSAFPSIRPTSGSRPARLGVRGFCRYSNIGTSPTVSKRAAL